MNNLKGARDVLSESITVLAPSCTWADALTKVLAIDPPRGVALLDRFDTKAMLLSCSSGQLHWRFLPSRKKDPKLTASDLK